MIFTTALSLDDARRAADPVPLAIAQHRRAYAVHLAAYARVDGLHALFDPHRECDTSEAIEEALLRHYGDEGAAEINMYFAAAQSSNDAANEEDEAWRRVATLEPATRADLTAWLAYVNEHAGRQDTAVTLAMALAHVGGMLSERLPA